MGVRRGELLQEYREKDRGQTCGQGGKGKRERRMVTRTPQDEDTDEGETEIEKDR